MLRLINFTAIFFLILHMYLEASDIFIFLTAFLFIVTHKRNKKDLLRGNNNLFTLFSTLFIIVIFAFILFFRILQFSSLNTFVLIAYLIIVSDIFVFMYYIFSQIEGKLKS